MSNTRPCVYAGPSDEKVTGTFHRWGNRTERDDGNGVHDVTYALIERTDGRVVEVDPYKVTFTDK